MSRHDTGLDRWEQLAVDFVTMFQQIPTDRRSKSIDGDWSARQVLQHLVEDEILFSTRVRAAIVDPGSTILPFDAERYQATLSYDLVPDTVLLGALLALRTINVEMLRALPDDAWERTVGHPESGDQSVEQIATIFGDHIADHLSDLQNAGLGRSAH